MSQAETFYGRKPAPVMASYSSRGPNKVQPSILKVFIHLIFSLFQNKCHLRFLHGKR
jgi:hypothetical protein